MKVTVIGGNKEGKIPLFTNDRIDVIKNSYLKTSLPD